MTPWISKLGNSFDRSAILASDRACHGELRRLRLIFANASCADCGAGDGSQWAVVNIGEFYVSSESWVRSVELRAFHLEVSCSLIIISGTKLLSTFTCSRSVRLSRSQNRIAFRHSIDELFFDHMS